MRIGLDPEEQSFRADVRAFLEGYRNLNGFFHQDERWPEVKGFYRALGERGWLSLTWPERWGGLGLGPVHEFILWDEAAYARAARPPLSAGIVAKTILRHGTDAQKQRWLPGIRSGELHFSLGYSEPQAGSDLAAVRTRAERSDDDYRVTGEKCWTSYAQDSDYLWLLCRTGAPDSRSAGLSLMILDLRADGVTVSPLPTLDDAQLNEIHLDGTRVPAEQRIGAENEAWKIVAEALADERHVQFPPRRLRRDLEDVIEWTRAAGLDRDATVRRGLADLAVEVLEVETHAMRVLAAVQQGRAGAVEAAANKVAGTVLCQKIARAAVEWGGPAAIVRGEPLEFLWRQSLWETIGGGTSEIMRGVVARQGLGLGGRR
ncbi:MAG: acyl-CoA dehydrogenase family protein [Myxococcales bacterium]|nr:acyl-CoA dehydrogenase family protein [Myxococcales bacterium]